MCTVEPYIAFHGTCREAIEFYQSAVDARLLFCQTFAGSPLAALGAPDQILHATLQIGDSHLMLCDDPSPSGPATSGLVGLTIGTSDPAAARRLFDALATGGTVHLPLQKTHWAEAFGMLTDQFGIHWKIHCTAATAPLQPEIR